MWHKFYIALIHHRGVEIHTKTNCFWRASSSLYSPPPLVPSLIAPYSLLRGQLNFNLLAFVLRGQVYERLKRLCDVKREILTAREVLSFSLLELEAPSLLINLSNGEKAIELNILMSFGPLMQDYESFFDASAFRLRCRSAFVLIFE